MKNIHIYFFLKCGVLNNFITTIISNYFKTINTFELDYICLYYVLKLKCKSSTINFNHYNFSLCVSFENIICHGIPLINYLNYNYLKIDISINYYKLHSDNCYNSNYYKKKNFFFKIFFLNIINNIKKNMNFSFFNNINKYIKNNFFIEDEYCSHGIFKTLHNKIVIQHNYNKNYIKIKNFDSFTIEPMFILKNNFNNSYMKIIFSKKNNFSFQWEHTLYIMNKKKILSTLRKNELCYIYH